MSYLHYDIIQKQSSKGNGVACGDHIDYFRTDEGLHLVLTDGLGSGIKANISARMCSQRIISLMQNGASMREAFSSMADNMNKIWGKGHPFAVFSIARILNNGETTVLSYEIPPPVVISKYSAVVVSDEVYTIGKAIIHESYCTLKEGEGLMMVSDGITQAGLGCGLVNGWEIEGVARFITNKIMTTELSVPDMAEEVHNHARRLWKDTKGDDCSVAIAHVRKGISINVFSGPPSNKELDPEVVSDFMAQEGIKVACGGTTSQVLARELNRRLEMLSDKQNALSPPKYKIKGINLVTEGIVTLNQVYNILGDDTSDLADESSVYELNSLLNMADRISFTIGHAENLGSGELQFKQQGILKRKTIIPLIIEKLRKSGKLVILNEIG
jgi:hypothetical protein